MTGRPLASGAIGRDTCIAQPQVGNAHTGFRFPTNPGHDRYSKTALRQFVHSPAIAVCAAA
jgi:hypothetical protein